MPRIDAFPPSSPDGLYADGPYITVHVGHDPKFTPESTSWPQARDLLALVDTGANESCIDSEIAETLDLPVADEQIFAGVDGRHKLSMYVAQIYVPELDYTIYGEFAGARLAEGGTDHRVLLDRSFLRYCTMIYDGPAGRVTILI